MKQLLITAVLAVIVFTAAAETITPNQEIDLGSVSNEQWYIVVPLTGQYGMSWHGAVKLLPDYPGYALPTIEELKTILRLFKQKQLELEKSYTTRLLSGTLNWDKSQFEPAFYAIELQENKVITYPASGAYGVILLRRVPQIK